MRPAALIAPVAVQRLAIGAFAGPRDLAADKDSA